MMYKMLIKLSVIILVMTKNIRDTHLNQFHKNRHKIKELKKLRKIHLLAIDIVYLIFIS